MPTGPLPDFALERYFAQWEFTAPHILCASDVEGYPMRELLALADDESRHLWESLSLGYTESAGHPLLREAIASMYTSVDADSILTFVGAEEAIFVLMHVLLQPGDHAVVMWPAYQSLYEVARANGVQVTLVPLDPAAGWSLDVEQIRREIRPNTRLLVTNVPHNPTGALPDLDTFNALVSLVEETGVSWLSDEVYRLLEYDETDRLPAAVDCTPRAISLGVMSKAFGLAGLRVGWIATHDTTVQQRAAAFKDYLTICGSAPSEILALVALRAQAHVLTRSRQIIATNLALLDTFFEQHRGTFEWVRPRAGSVAFPRLCRDIPVDQFTADLVEQAGVLLLPGTVYGYPGSHFRIGFGRSDMGMALEKLAHYAATRL